MARATSAALQALDHGFFRVRLDRLTPREKDYLRAMAEPQYGDTAFTVPLFDAFMKRSRPDWKPPRKKRAT